MEIFDKKNKRFDSELIDIINKSVSDLLKLTILQNQVNNKIYIDYDTFLNKLKLKKDNGTYRDLRGVLFDILCDISPNKDDTKWWKDKRFSYLFNYEQPFDGILTGLYVSLVDSENFFRSCNFILSKYTNVDNILQEKDPIFTNFVENLFSNFVKKHSIRIISTISCNRINTKNKTLDMCIKNMNIEEKKLYNALIENLNEDLDELKEYLAGYEVVNETYINGSDEYEKKQLLDKEVSALKKNIKEDKEKLFKYVDDKLKKGKISFNPGDKMTILNDGVSYRDLHKIKDNFNSGIINVKKGSKTAKTIK